MFNGPYFIYTYLVQYKHFREDGDMSVKID